MVVGNQNQFPTTPSAIVVYEASLNVGINLMRSITPSMEDAPDAFMNWIIDQSHRPVQSRKGRSERARNARIGREQGPAKLGSHLSFPAVTSLTSTPSQ